MSVSGAALMSSHLQFMMAGFGSSAVSIYGGSTTTHGLRDQEERIEESAQGLRHVLVNVLYVQAGSLYGSPDMSHYYQNPPRDTPITIDGGTYKVRETLLMGDGQVLKVEFA